MPSIEFPVHVAANLPDVMHRAIARSSGVFGFTGWPPPPPPGAGLVAAFICSFAFCTLAL
jgi:hypothetical protein